MKPAEKKRSYRELIYSLIYALISVACPFIAAQLIIIYQKHFYWDLTWPRVAMTELEVARWVRFLNIQDWTAVLIGTAIGLGFALLSLRKRPRVLISENLGSMIFFLSVLRSSLVF